MSALAQTVVVTGSREPLAPERLAADVAVIDGATLRNSTADSLADLLRREAGLQLSRSGGPGQSTGLFIRGTGSQQSVVLIDGVRVGSATLGYAAVEGISLSQVERIEVLRGPGSSLYGADAVGGVVQIITRSGERGLQPEARIAVGGYGAREASASLRGKASVLEYGITLATERADGVSAVRPGDQWGTYNPDHDGYRLDTFQAHASLKPAPDQRVGLSLLHTQQDTHYDAAAYPPPSYMPDASPDFRTRAGTTLAALDWNGALASGLSGSARVSRSVDDSRNGLDQADRYRTEREQVMAQLAWQTGVLGQLVGALEHSVDHVRSTSYSADEQRRNTAAVLELTGDAKPWAWQLDVRHDDNSDFGAVDTGRIGGTLELAAGWRLRALAGNTFRAPSFNDLYYPGYGVKTLQPERGRSIELGLNWHHEGSQASATVYQNRVHDLIGYTSDRSLCPASTDYTYGCAANVDRARLRGLTLAGSQRLGDWTFKAQVDGLQARDQATGERLPRRAAQQETLGADWAAGSFSFGAAVLNVGSRPDGGKTLRAETTLDLNAGWRVAPGWWLQAKLLNATNRDLEPVRDYQGLGRQAWLVLRWEPAV